MIAGAGAGVTGARAGLPPVRVVLVDDAAASRAAFRRFARMARLDVVGDATDAASGAALCARLEPDVAIVDGRLPPDGAAPFVARLSASHPTIRIFVVAALDETALVRAARAAGATGALLRPILPSQLVRALAPAPDAG